MIVLDLIMMFFLVYDFKQMESQGLYEFNDYLLAEECGLLFQSLRPVDSYRTMMKGQILVFAVC